ncbi:hypothetical protein ABW21_db0200270 [Orbilia brochopaga]|nr:hypothetical protein ABW21_db0200270 [Drechslerella brochopaga]
MSGTVDDTNPKSVTFRTPSRVFNTGKMPSCFTKDLPYCLPSFDIHKPLQHKTSATIENIRNSFLPSRSWPSLGFQIKFKHQSLVRFGTEITKSVLLQPSLKCRKILSLRAGIRGKEVPSRRYTLTSSVRSSPHSQVGNCPPTSQAISLFAVP